MRKLFFWAKESILGQTPSVISYYMIASASKPCINRINVEEGYDGGKYHTKNSC